MNVNKLKGKIVENEMTIEKLADLIGTSKSSLYRKLNNGEKVTIGEAKRIKDALKLSNSDACEIFLA